MQVYLRTLGCRLNEAELESWSRQFAAAGHTLTNTPDQADLVVINTCAVTQEAVAKSRRLMRRMHRANPVGRLVVTGCYASLAPAQAASALGVDLVVTNQDKDRLVSIVEEALAVPSMPLAATEPASSALFSRGRHRAFVKIQDGCRYRCSFCVVTLARGEERSRPLADVVAQINELHESGVQEAVLTGVHVGGYGSDLGLHLTDLVGVLLRDTDIPRLRFGSVEPWDLPEDFFTLFDNPRLMPHLHLPLQSGSDSILRHMSRRCKSKAFRTLVEQARREISSFNVTTDIIVGFPGESEEDWRQTLAFVESVGFGHLHIFPYSPRSGTKSAELPDPVPEPVKRARSQTLHELGRRMKQRFLASQIGQKVPVLWEGSGRTGTAQSRFWGYTPNFARVAVEAPEHLELANRIRWARVESVAASGDHCIAQLL